MKSRFVFLALLAGTASIGALEVPTPASATEERSPLLVINGHQSLTSAEVIHLETLARKLGEEVAQKPTEASSLLGILNEEDRGLFKRALALRALCYAGMGIQAFNAVKLHRDLPLLELITSTMATHIASAH